MGAGESLDNERGRQRVREILDAAKGQGPSDTDRVGEKTAYRYLAAKSSLSLLQGQAPNYGGLNRLGTLNGALMSPAGDAMKLIAKLTGAVTKTARSKIKPLAILLMSAKPPIAGFKIL